MGKIHKFTDKNGVGLYPVTISDAVAVTKNNKTLSDSLKDIDSSISTVDAKLGGYKISVVSSAGNEAKTIYFVI